MPSTSFIDGTNLRITLSDDAGTTKKFLFHVQQSDLSMSKETSDITTKDTGGGTGWREVFGKQKSATLTANGLLFYDITGDNANIVELFAIFDADTLIDWEFGTAVVGDPLFSGQGIITSLNQSAPADTESSWDMTIDVFGAVAQATVT